MREHFVFLIIKAVMSKNATAALIYMDFCLLKDVCLMNIVHINTADNNVV
jgi:hypothetical protein